MENNNENEVKHKEHVAVHRKSSKNILDLHMKRSSIYPKLFLSLREEILKKKSKNIPLIEFNDKEILRIYKILKKDNKKRNKKDNIELFLFLTKIKIKEYLKTDLLYSDYTMETLYNFMNPYITPKIHQSGEVIYSYGDEADNFYIILMGNVGQYRLDVTEESLISEDYYIYLSDQYNGFQKSMIDQLNDKNLYMKEKEYTDVELLMKIVNVNKEVYPLFMFEDIESLKDIIITIKVYIKIIENKSSDIIKIYEKYDVPLSFLNYDKLIRNDISVHNYIKNISQRIDRREQFYMKYLGKNQENKVKMMKYVKIKDLKQFYYFGNFEMIDTRPHRIDTARCENDNTLLMVINKKSYSTIINDLQKEKRNKEINFLHNYFYFKIINKIHFESKMFTKFRINYFLKGNILLNQEEIINNFIFIREGTIETSINNISLIEFAHRIKILYDFIVKKAREYDINIKDIIDFDVTLNHKTTLQLNLIEDFLKQKQNFVLSRTERGSFGDYELFFNVPSFITATIISKSGKVYFYNYENFKKVNEEVHAFNETLKEISFSKLKSMLKRMVTIYNSTFIYNIKQIETKLIEKENKLKALNTSISSKEEGDTNTNYNNEPQKHFSSPINIFIKNKINKSNIINTFNDLYNKTNIDLKGKSYKIKKNKVYDFFSYDLGKTRTFKSDILYQMNSFKSYYYLKKKNSHLNNSLNKKNNSNNLSSDNSFNEKKIKVFKRSYDNSESNSKNRNDVNNSKIHVLKTDNNSNKKKLCDVFLPPLLTSLNFKNKGKKKDEYQNENNKLNYHLLRHCLSIENSINDTSLGHKNKSNGKRNELFLSNIFEKKSNFFQKKPKSMNIKKAQINIIKNRGKIIKKVLQKKREDELF